MRRIDEKGLSIFDVEDVVALLAHQRDEAFEGERAIRLYQFRIWIFFRYGRSECGQMGGIDNGGKVS